MLSKCHKALSAGRLSEGTLGIPRPYRAKIAISTKLNFFPKKYSRKVTKIILNPRRFVLSAICLSKCIYSLIVTELPTIFKFLPNNFVDFHPIFVFKRRRLYLIKFFCQAFFLFFCKNFFHEFSKIFFEFLVDFLKILIFISL